MSVFKARNPGLVMALAAEGFVPAGKDKVTHPTLVGHEAKRAFQRAWNLTLKVAGENGSPPRTKCGDPQCNCKGYFPFGNPWQGDESWSDGGVR
jgi:hypothetical protein